MEKLRKNAQLMSEKTKLFVENCLFSQKAML